VIANFKMNGTVGSTIEYGNELFDLLFENELYNTTIVMAPSAIHLAYLQSRLIGTRIKYGGQDLCGQAQFGSHTGNTSAEQLADLGCTYSIIGHSERRKNLGETDCIISNKLSNATLARITPILCVGEDFTENREGHTWKVIKGQLDVNLAKFDSTAKIMIAYEPIWSIGTGKIPSLQDVQNVVDHIADYMQGRGLQAELIYGGSVTGANAEELLMVKNLSGFLVGGASLKVSTFWPIIQACEAVGKQIKTQSA